MENPQKGLVIVLLVFLIATFAAYRTLRIPEVVAASLSCPPDSRPLILNVGQTPLPTPTPTPIPQPTVTPTPLPTFTPTPAPALNNFNVYSAYAVGDNFALTSDGNTKNGVVDGYVTVATYDGIAFNAYWRQMTLSGTKLTGETEGYISYLQQNYRVFTPGKMHIEIEGLNQNQHVVATIYDAASGAQVAHFDIIITSGSISYKPL